MILQMAQRGQITEKVGSPPTPAPPPPAALAHPSRHLWMGWRLVWLTRWVVGPPQVSDAQLLSLLEKVNTQLAPKATSTVRTRLASKDSRLSALGVHTALLVVVPLTSATGLPEA